MLKEFLRGDSRRFGPLEQEHKTLLACLDTLKQVSDIIGTKYKQKSKNLKFRFFQQKTQHFQICQIETPPSRSIPSDLFHETKPSRNTT